MGKRERKTKFLETAPYRINMAVKWIDSVIECSDMTEYHYLPRHVEMLTQHLENALGRVKESYSRGIELTNSRKNPFYFNAWDRIKETKLKK
jgi:hypothetical protein